MTYTKVLQYSDENVKTKCKFAEIINLSTIEFVIFKFILSMLIQINEFIQIKIRHVWINMSQAAP